MRSEYWVNADGLTIGQGPANTKNVEAATIETKGNVRSIEMEVYFDEDGSTASMKKAVLPAGARVLSAAMVVSTAFTGGTAITVGTITADGLTADADALVTATEGAVANLTANAVVTGAGVLAGKVVTSDVQVTYTRTGTFTAGRGSVVIEYVMPSAK